MSVRAAELLMGFLTLALSIAIMVKSTELTIGWVPERGPGAGAWPFWLAGGMALASIATIIRWFQRATPESRSTEPYIDKDTVFLVLVTVAALTAAIVATAWIGMYFSLMAFLLFYLKVIGRHGWGTTIAVVLATPVLIFCLFEWALKKYLPKGIPAIEALFLPLYDLIY